MVRQVIRYGSVGHPVRCGEWSGGFRMGYGGREAGRWGFRPSGEWRTVTSRRAGRMRQTRIEKPRRPARTRRYADATPAPFESLDPRDPDIVRAKRLRPRPQGKDTTGS
ncbi:hypothetical protein GCM10010294_21650 [Streptomyces griseoloalbus]|nr:hypothetical protein GCM10010294_21650 [Streptomyces griseoloalbus]